MCVIESSYLYVISKLNLKESVLILLSEKPAFNYLAELLFNALSHSRLQTTDAKRRAGIAPTLPICYANRKVPEVQKGAKIGDNIRLLS